MLIGLWTFGKKSGRPACHSCGTSTCFSSSAYSGTDSVMPKLSTAWFRHVWSWASWNLNQTKSTNKHVKHVKQKCGNLNKNLEKSTSKVSTNHQVAQASGPRFDSSRAADLLPERPRASPPSEAPPLQCPALQRQPWGSGRCKRRANARSPRWVWAEEVGRFEANTWFKRIRNDKKNLSKK